MAKGGEKEWIESCEIMVAIEELSLLKNEGEEKKLSTLAFLHLSNLLLQVLDKIGPTMSVLSLDIRRNIERLEEMYLLDPSCNSSLMEIVEKDVKEGTVGRLTAALELFSGFLGRWISVWHSAYKIALQLTPDREVFVGLLMGKDKDNAKFKGEIYKLVTLIQPFLHEIYELMKKYRLERLKST
ncbi:Glycolipid transfer protein 3 [Rhynchospora pubera]|uniref:Glycolipid transfer protein 3 n=1 Tax=Rhynchospora pubera TaxID=906938 RepID=A0AAV8FFU7_9POAL|nr:Glycolipid transfer protein 3 [Rhynchospora pubera]